MAKNWMSPAELTFDQRIASAFTLVLLGVAVWDVLRTIDFDWSIISGKRKWRWPMLAYFVTRICMLMHIIGQAINMNAIKQIPCQQVVYITKVSDVIGTCGVTVILALRTIAVWHQSKKVIAGLGLLFCGQFVIWINTLRFSRSMWNPQRGGCQVLSTAPRPLLITVFAYTMVLDLIILILCAVRLASSSRHGGIATLLLRDGIGYFVAAFGANLIQTIFAAMQLNPVMNIMCLPFALVASVIAASTVFRNVFTLHDGFVSHHLSSSASGGVTSPTTRQGFAGFGGRTRDPAPAGISLAKLRSRSEPQTISVHKIIEVEQALDDSVPHHPYVNNDIESLGLSYTSDEKRGPGNAF